MPTPLLPLRLLPNFGLASPKIVTIYDRIRGALAHGDSTGKYEEFYWFAREYSRVFRYHQNHARHRLRSIHEVYEAAHKQFAAELAHGEPRDLERVLSTPRINLLYWDFEAFLSAVGSALDILARVVGPAYEEQAPVSFNRLCSKQNLAGPANVFRSAKAQWVNRLKDYRDCFVHYTPADTRGWLRIVRWADGWEVRGRLPVNPNVRDIFAFRFSRRVDMLPYCLVTLRHLATFEKRVATTLWNLFREGQFPKRTRHLVGVGQRRRD